MNVIWKQVQEAGISVFQWNREGSLGPEAAWFLARDFQKLGRSGTGRYQVLLDEIFGQGRGAAARLIVRALYQGAYCFRKEALKEFNGKTVYEMRDELASYGDAEIVLVSKENLEEDIRCGEWEGRCIGYARSLGNLPNNYLHTEEMAAYAKALGKELDCFVDILRDESLKALSGGGILAVNQGSSREAAMVVLRYEGAPGKPTTALVGKGVMFDSGGYHLKNMDGMQNMKLDMCGAANVLETFEILVRGGVKKNVIAILVLVENVIGPEACKMGDVVTMMGGQTVEIYNTDAEGRLILADGLEYAQRMGATQVIDAATLTYSCQAALGDCVTGTFCNDDEWYKAWEQAARNAGEKIWRLPLDQIYHEYLKWPLCADISNYAPGKAAGASVAACFLEEFIYPETVWIHLDMVGPAVNRGDQEQIAEGATGAMIASLVYFLQS